jgi:hypothetical protein
VKEVAAGSDGAIRHTTATGIQDSASGSQREPGEVQATEPGTNCSPFGDAVNESIPKADMIEPHERTQDIDCSDTR